MLPLIPSPRALALGLLALAAAGAPAAQVVTGLSNWTLYIDPGHSQNENVGVYGYSEARKVLRVSNHLRDMLTTRTDIGAVFTSRTTDAQSVSLTQRTDQANTLGAAFFHSIHSNAGGPGTNNVLMLYGGWRRNGQTIEKTPVGGGRMGDEYDDAITSAYRIPSIGNYADRTFYEGFPDNHTNTWPYLHVNRESNMASVLSESGFHTNPAQNQRNMNAEWKRLEAQAFYWAILDWHGAPRSTHRILTGIVTDAESGRPINGAVIAAGGQTYTTDTYASLFNQYSSDPDELANGFYYLEDLPAGTTTAQISAEGYTPASPTFTLNETDFTFADAALVSTIPPTVAASTPADGAAPVRVTDPISVTFSRKMDAASLQAAFSLSPATTGTFQLSADRYRLTFTPAQPLEPQTAYTLTIAGTALGIYGDALDGNADGTGGDAFQIGFTTGFPDTAAPTIAGSYPANNAAGVELRPVLGLTLNEPVLVPSLSGRITLEVNDTQAPVPGRFVHTLAGMDGPEPAPRSIVSFAPDAPLAPNTRYRLAMAAGVEDGFGNATTTRRSLVFRTGTTDQTVRAIDGFEGSSIADNWWLPQQSGSTTGIVTDSTARSASTAVPNLLGGTTSMRIDYGWDAGASTWLIRQYLNGGPPRSVIFDTTATIQAYVFGDGTGTRFRFAIDDGSSQHEVSPWVAVDWFGWRPVSWDLGSNDFGTWIGNGAWDVPTQLRFDSIQLGYDGASPRFGTLYVDDLRLVQPFSVDAEGEADAPAEALTVLPGQPNPLRGSTVLPFVLRDAGAVTVRVYNALGQQVAVLADEATFGPGRHLLTWDASSVAAGVYVARFEAATAVRAVRLVVTR
jgi:N-acetylmuramoyl-L-alanine amidase